MTREAIKRLLIVTGLALLMIIGVVLPLHAASSSRATRPQETGQVTLELASTPSTTVTAGQNLTLTATISNGSAISITDTSLIFGLPPGITSDNQPQSWDSILTNTAEITMLPLLIPEQISGIVWFTAELNYHTMTETVNHITISASYSITVAAPPPPEPTDTPSPSPLPPTATPTEIPPTDTPTQEPTPTATETPTASPPTPTAPPPTATPFDPIASLLEHKTLVGGGCLLLLLLIFIFTLLLLIGRKRKRRLGTVPPPPAGPYLENIGITGDPRRFDLGPDGATIGRAEENSLVITQNFDGWETVSRQHARIYEHGKRWIVEDAGSMNGVYVNGKRTGRNLLRDGWRIGIGSVEFTFHTGAGEAQQ